MKKSPFVTYSIAFVVVTSLSVAAFIGADYFRASPDKIEARYVGRESCASCHQPQQVAFEGSDHDLAMDLATEETVLADFDDQTIEHYGITSRMFRQDGKFMVRTDGPDGEMHDYVVKYVFGVRPLQQYMVEIDRPVNAKENEVGRVQVLRMSWDTVRNQWFYLMPPDVDEYLKPTDPLHWTGITQNWNASCASCHSTNVHKNFTASVAEYRTTFSEIDVSCEACHGPASFHVELANRNSMFWDRQHGYGLAKLKVDSNVPQVESCAPCHSRRTAMSESFQPGCNFDDYFATQIIVDPIYHVDGQVRDEDYVYGSFIQSKMYHNDVKCTDCHDPHTSKLKHVGNALCTSCHQNKHPAGEYDTPEHHHHAPGTPGSFCVDCHMPSTTYMMVDHRRDHSFRVPRPDLSLAVGVPNACSGCHLDSSILTKHQTKRPIKQYLDWIIAAEQGDEVIAAELTRTNEAMQKAVESWYTEAPKFERNQYYEKLARGLAGRQRNSTATLQPAAKAPKMANPNAMVGDNSDSIQKLMELSLDSKAPAIIRASAVAGLANDGQDQSFETALKALKDWNPKVVAAALLRVDAEIGRVADRLQFVRNPEDVNSMFQPISDALAPLFRHPSRRVRTEAARVFATLDSGIKTATTTPKVRRDYQRAIDELVKSLLVENDRASTHMMLGGLHELQREPALARDEYRAAIAIEPNVAGPRSNLAAMLEAELNERRSEMQRVQSGQGGPVQAGQFKTLLSDMRRLQENIAKLRAEEHLLLEEDIQRSAGLPDTHGLHYRFAMSAFLQGDGGTTEKHLKLAHQQQPKSATYLLGLATFYVQFQKPDDALTYIDALLELDPEHQGYLNLKRAAAQIKQRQSSSRSLPEEPNRPAANKEKAPQENDDPKSNASSDDQV